VNYRWVGLDEQHGTRSDLSEYGERHINQRATGIRE
jgi:hypothetical protein